ncbi:MAG: T9SS type A sorting domain-containing protein [Bacteroidales bacterium]|nr:T9SS type A sorting domain-containing protein [Bacteroidales bacterium]
MDSCTYAFSTASNLLYVDKDINLIKESFSNNGIKFNNKFYSIILHTSLQPIMGFNFDRIDSISMVCTNAFDTNITTTKTIFHSYNDTIILTQSFVDFKFRKLSDNTFLLIFNSLPHIETGSSDFEVSKLMIIDTLCNVIKEKTWHSYIASYDVCETKNHIVINKICAEGGDWFSIDGTNFYYNSVGEIYFFDKDSLTLQDSISNKHSMFSKRLNEYEFLAWEIGGIIPNMDHVITFYTIDSRTKSITRTFMNNTDLLDVYSYNGDGEHGEYLSSFITEDSVYIVLGYDSIDEYFTKHKVGIIVLNINPKDGKTNFTIDIPLSDYNDNALCFIGGIQATSDGGAIVSIGEWSELGDRSLLVKVMPDGFVSITNIIEDSPIALCYPNPAKDKINFSCSEQIKEIEIFNNLGQKVLSRKINNKFTTIDVANLATGNYIAKIHTDKTAISKKFNVAR